MIAIYFLAFVGVAALVILAGFLLARWEHPELFRQEERLRAQNSELWVHNNRLCEALQRQRAATEFAIASLHFTVFNYAKTSPRADRQARA